MKHTPKIITETTTDRGFARLEFEDRYGEKCSLQQSSLANEPCIWLGIDAHRMHLTPDHAKELIPILQTFAETGYLIPAPETAEERDRLKEEVEYLRTFSNAGVLASNDKGRKIVKLKEINSELLRALRIFIEPTTKRIYNVFNRGLSKSEIKLIESAIAKAETI